MQLCENAPGKKKPNENGPTQNKTIKVGLMFIKYNEFVGYTTSAGALNIAQDRIWKENLLPGYSFKYNFSPFCSEFTWSQGSEFYGLRKSGLMNYNSLFRSFQVFK